MPTEPAAEIDEHAGGRNAPLVLRLEQVLHPDPTRVALRPFTPAENGPGGDTSARSRVQRIVERVLSLNEEGLGQELQRVIGVLAQRHGDIEPLLLRRFRDLGEEAVRGREIGHDQQLAIGSYFVEEYSFESSALF